MGYKGEHKLEQRWQCTSDSPDIAETENPSIDLFLDSVDDVVRARVQLGEDLNTKMLKCIKCFTHNNKCYLGKSILYTNHMKKNSYRWLDHSLRQAFDNDDDI